MTRAARIAAALATGAVLLTACSPHYPPGPAGRVTDRDSFYRKADGWHYSLTVRDKKFRVTRDEYRNCVHGSSYPGCTKRTDRH